MARMGTRDWMARTGGRLGWRDRMAMTLQAVQARAAARRSRDQAPPLPGKDVDDIVPPDSAIAREAVALCQDASPPYLFNHCLRAYVWARLLDDGAEGHDDEAVFTAMMLHDLGLTHAYRHAGPTACCFTVAGAAAADALALRHGWSERRAQLASQAITLHLNVVVDARHGKEARMVRAGSGGDVAGLALHRLAPEQIGAVLERYPRLDMKRQIVRELNREAEECPDCRMAFLVRRLRFDRLILDSPVFGE